MARRLGLFAIAVVLLIAAAAFLVHAPFVRARVLRYAVTTLENQYGIRVEASRLDYSLVSLRVGLADVRVSAVGKQPPFFEADYVAVAVPRRTLLGEVVLDEVSVSNGVVRIVRQASGEANLPESTAPAAGEPEPLNIGRITLSPLRLDIRDEGSGFALDVPASELQLAADNGRIAFTSPATVRVGDRGTRITKLEGGARFDGRTLTLSAVQVDAEEGQVQLDGPVTVIASEPSIDVRAKGTADIARLARWGMAEAEAPRGQVVFAAHAVGSMSGPSADFDVTSPRIAWQDRALSNVTATGRVTSDVLSIKHAALDIEGGSVDGSAEMPFADVNALTAAVRIRLEDRPTPFIPLAMPGESRLTVADRSWRLDGEHRVGSATPAKLALRGRIANDLSRSTVTGVVQVPDADVPMLVGALRRAKLVDVPADSVPVGRVRGDARLSGTFARMQLAFSASSDNLRLTNPQAEGPVALTGTFDTGTERYTFDAMLNGWMLTPTTDLPVRGRVNATVRGSGRAAAVMADGDVMAADLAWQDVAIGDVTATVAVDPKVAHIKAKIPQFNTIADGQVGISAPYMTSMTARVDDLDLARVIGTFETPVRVAGTTSLMLRAEGPLEEWRDGTADLEISRFDATAGDLPVRLLSPALLRYQREHIAINRFEAAAGETHILASGEIAAFGTGSQEPGNGNASAGIIATISGDVGEVTRAVAATGLTELPVSGGNGPVALLARVGGSLEAPLVSADLEIGPGAITLTDLPTISELRVRTHVEDGWADVRELHGAYQGATVTGTGRAPLSLLGVQVPGAVPGDASLRAKITGVTAAVLEPFIDPTAASEVSGSIDATVSVDAPSLDVAAVRGELQLDRLEIRVADLPVGQRVPTRIVVRDGLARVEAWDWTGQGANLSVRGQVRLEDLQAAILTNGDVDLRMATPFVRAAGLTTAGSLQPRLSITGPLTDPRIDGDLTVSGGELRLIDPRVIVSDLNGRAVLTRSTATLASMTGSINGGSLTVDGTAEFATDGQGSARLGAGIQGMALEFPVGLRSELDADLRLVAESLPGEDLPNLRIEGTVTMLRGSYREPLAVVTGLLANLQAAGVAATAPTAEGGAVLDRLALDVRLVTDEDILVDNNYGQIQLGADLRVIGTAAAPALSGRAELREGGQLFVGRNIYTIRSGTIDFANPTIIEPNMNLELTTRAGGYDIEVTIMGTPETLSVALDAPSAPDPQPGQADLTALLVTGRTLDQLSNADAALIGTQVLGNFSADLLGFAGRAIGLDTLRIGGVQTSGTLGDTTVLTTDLDPTSRLTFGKRFGSDLDVTFSQSLRDGDAQTWIVEYRPSNRFEARLVSNDEDMASLGFRHDVSFGGGLRRVDRPVARRTETRVASVAMTGDLIAPEERLRDLLSLTEGDRFDFGEWQRDRDRLLQFYQDQSHLTARVNATRKDADAGVVLAYAMVTGARTEIVVRGADLPAPAMAELRRAWGDAVFDSFLIDEATQIVRGALAREGYLQAQVMARLDRTGTSSAGASASASEIETVALMIDVMPGPRTNSVSIRIQGADPALTEQLSAEVMIRGLAERVAIDPGSVERELTEYLRTRGYLRARVTTGAPLFEGDAAIVPVTVMGGAPVVIGAIEFDGVARLPIAQVREAAAIAPGIPADIGVIDLARQRVVALYRREGFASATATTRQAVRGSEPLLDVTFVVMEGLRQALAEIAVTGNGSIDTDVIERALGLTLNQPLRAEEWLQARTRVFDTGLFRRVDVSSEPIAGGASPEGTVPMRMRVVVEEWPILRARYGVQVAQERPEDSVTGRDLVPGLSADITRRTLFGRAVTVGAAAGLQRRERLGRVFVNAPTMLRLPIQSSLILERARRNFASDTLVTHTQGIAWEQRVRATPTINLSYTYRFESNHTFDTDPDPTLPFDVLVHVGRLTSSVAWDTRDDPGDATRGALVSTSLELAAQRLASDISYLRWLSQGYYFKPYRGVVFASAARVGLVGPLAGQELLPSFRFFVGGARTIRGVEEEGVGERDFFGDPKGGQGLLVLNQEVRFPIYRWIRGVGFIDTGTVLPETKIAFRDMTTSTGFGLRLMTPFGILRADYGRVLSSEFALPKSSLWSFGIGQAF